MFHHEKTAPTVNLFGRDVFSGSVDEFLEILAGKNPPETIGYFNAHTVNMLFSEPEYRSMIQQFDLVYGDGMSVVNTARKGGFPFTERINAGDFFQRFLWKCKANHQTIALAGSSDDVINEAVERLNSYGLNSVISSSQNGYFWQSVQAKAEFLDRIRQQKPDFILLGMGSPKQEETAFWLKSVLESEKDYQPVIWCVGALFEYYSGRKRAPVLMRELGLEWVFRLMLEPRRLWKRYLIGNICYMVREKSELRRLKKNRNSKTSEPENLR